MQRTQQVGTRLTACLLIAILWCCSALAGPVRDGTPRGHAGPIVFSPDGQSLLALRDSLELWNLQTGRKKNALRTGTENPPPAAEELLAFSLWVSPDRRWVLDYHG